MSDSFLVAAQGQGLSTQWPLIAVPLAVAAVAAGLLFRVGAPGDRPERWARQAARIPNTLERITGIPGWAAGVLAVGLFAPVLSVTGFYADVSWHTDFGRDKIIFTPPHTMITAGLMLLPVSAVLGIVSATVTSTGAGFRWGFWRVPWSILPLAAFGTAAFVGFPLDDGWHEAYGMDVTLWSPTHLLMLAGGELSTIALWMVLREAGVRPRDGAWPLAVYALLAALTLVRLSTFHDEFDLGVPQFQHLFHPVIVALTAGLGLVFARLAFGRGGAVVMAVGFLAVRAAVGLFVGPALGYTVPRFPLYLPAALAVEAVAAGLGTARRLRFALAAGAAVGTVGLAAEWSWTHAWGRHPWRSALFPEAFLVGGLAALGAALLGAAAGGAMAGDDRRLPTGAVAGAVLAVAVALAVPASRGGDDVTGSLNLERRGDEAVVTVALAPPDAADDARWFEVLSWQGGGVRQAPLHRIGPGRYATRGTVPVTGDWRTLIRLHRGERLVGIPVYLPEDPEIRAPLVPAVDGERRFVPDTKLLLREVKAGPAWPRLVIYTGIGLAAAAAAAITALAAVRIEGRPSRRTGPRQRERSRSMTASAQSR